ncbi:MAG TPA: response regulator FixJ [Acetobacteraceae bacterium]|jgi:two-component system response regulator FixJ|nr:response regulator FixJ [Acetobacteraceae bacterium]HEX4367239.1 response regulator FixJ [Rhodopila sp.]
MARDAVIHLIDDDAAVRRAVAFLLTSAGYAVRVYESAEAFLLSDSTLQPGCVITDVRMPGMDGLELQRTINARRMPFPVIVLTGNGDVPLAVEAMKAGAVDFIEKPFDDDVLLAAITTAVDRHAKALDHHAEMAAIGSKMATLSVRESEVMDGLIAGHPNKVIGFDLGISVRTVEVHRANLMMKMGAGSLSELVKMAFVARSGI